MPLTMTYEGNLCVPLVYCDHCQREIRNAADGNYQWLWSDAPARIYFTHKACCKSFEKRQGGLWGAIPLEILPVFLIRNLGVEWKDAQRQADYLAQL